MSRSFNSRRGTRNSRHSRRKCGSRCPWCIGNLTHRHAKRDAASKLPPTFLQLFRDGATFLLNEFDSATFAEVMRR